MVFHLDMQKDTVVNTISSVMLDPDGGNVPTAIQGITDVIVVTAGGREIPLGLGGYLDIGILDTMKDLFVNLSARWSSPSSAISMSSPGARAASPAFYPPGASRSLRHPNRKNKPRRVRLSPAGTYNIITAKEEMRYEQPG